MPKSLSHHRIPATVEFGRHATQSPMSGYGAPRLT